MIELTEPIVQALASRPGEPLHVRHPNTGEAYVLLKAEDYTRLLDYDDSPWTDEERAALAWEAGRVHGWEEMDEYDNYEKPS